MNVSLHLTLTEAVKCIGALNLDKITLLKNVPQPNWLWMPVSYLPKELLYKRICPSFVNIPWFSRMTDICTVKDETQRFGLLNAEIVYQAIKGKPTWYIISMGVFKRWYARCAFDIHTDTVHVVSSSDFRSVLLICVDQLDALDHQTVETQGKDPMC